MKYDRLTQIKHLLMRDKKLSNAVLAETFGVSLVTIRRDLDQLEADGLIRRFYGGAEIIDNTNTSNIVIMNTDRVPPWQNREAKSSTEKCAIANKVVEQIPDGCTVFIDSGTTAYEVAKLLVDREQLTVLTNSMRVVVLLGMYPNLQTYCIGGIVKCDMLTTAGIIASECLSFFPSIDVCVLSADSFVLTGGLRELSMETAMLKKAVIDKSRTVIAALDHEKFNVSASATICGTDQLDIIVTDSDTPEETVVFLKECGVEVIVAPLE